MADVGPGMDADRDRNRAQMIVIGALALAVTLVALGLVLNLAIFTENLTTRDVNQEAADTAEHQETSVQSVARAMRYVNLNDKGSLDSGLNREMRRLNERHARYAAGQGSITNVSLVSTERGTRIRQVDETRKFTNESGVSDWTVATDVERTNRFFQRIDRGSLLDLSLLEPDLKANSYHIAIKDSNGDIWRVYVFQISEPGNAYLTVQEPGESLTDLNLDQLELCTANQSKVELDLPNSKFGNSNADCDQLDFFGETASASAMSTSYTVMYNNTDTLLGSVKGTYDILIDKDSLSASTVENYASSDTDDPFQHQAFFEATVETTYRRSEIAATTTRKTHPVASLSSFPGFLPRIDTFDVQDNSDSDAAKYDVTWAVSDRDGDLDEVRLYLTNKTDNERKDEKTISVSGDSAGPTTTHLEYDPLAYDSGHDYVIRIVVLDQNGNVVSKKVEDTADGTDP